MRRNPLECFMFFLFLIVSGGESTSVRNNLFQENDLVSSTISNKSPISIISPIDYPDRLHSCLYVSPDLPSCQFRKNKNLQRFYRSINEEIINTNRESNHHRGHVTVYSLQGCLPSRLPFRMKLCESKDLLEKSTKIWKLYPFQIGEDEKIESAFIFPSFDINRWSKSMRLLREERDKIKRNNDRENILRTISQEYLSPSMIAIENNYNLNDLTKSLSNSIIDENLRNSLTNERKRKRRRRKRSVRLNRRDIRMGSEFPYSKSIPFDPKKLGLPGRFNKFF